MSSRIFKSINRKTKERKFLAEAVELSREFADMLYSYYFKYQKECLITADSSCCSEYIRCSRSCDSTCITSSCVYPFLNPLDSF
jgi:hypothetical protein